MSDLKETLLNHPRNEKIRFLEEPHEYWYYESGDFRKTTERVQYQGITGWIGDFCSKFDAEAVLDQHYDNWQRTKDERYYGMSREEIKQQWFQKGDDARNKGNEIHKAIENCVNFGVYDEDMSFYIDRFWECMDSHNIEPFVSEMVLYDEDIQRASPADVLGIKDGKIFPLDLKSYEDGMEFLSYDSERMRHPLGDLFDSKWEKVNLQISILRKFLIKNYVDEEHVADGATLLLNDDGCKFIPALDYVEYVDKMYDYE